MKLRTMLATLVMLATASSLTAQATDSVTINVLSPPVGISITAPEDAYRGDTIQVAYSIVDDTGQPTAGVATWRVQDSGENPRAEIIEQTDSTVSVVLLRAGPVTLVVDVARVDRVVIGGRYLVPGPANEAGDFQWQTEGEFRIYADDDLALCAVGFAGARALFVSNDDCYDNLATLTGNVPPLGGDLIRRADVSYVLQPVYLRPDLFNFSG